MVRVKKHSLSEQLFLARWNQICKLIIRMSMGAAVICILTQGILQIPVVRQWVVKVERLEGVRFEYP